MTAIHHRHFNKLSRLKLALLLTAIGMVVEFIGGFLSNSLALISDAWHMLTHLFALGLSYFAALLVLRPASKKHTYGFYRAEVLAAFINGITLIFISGYIIYDALTRFLHPPELKIFEMLFVAIFGLIINGVSIFLLAKAGSEDLNIRSAILHELGDIISSVAVVAGAVFIFYTKNYLVDPLLAFFICILITVWAIRLLIESGHILFESTPKHLDIDEIRKVLKQEVSGIDEIHHVHIWAIAPSMLALTAHVVIVEDCSVSAANKLLNIINNVLKTKFNIGHTNIQFECLTKKADT